MASDDLRGLLDRQEIVDITVSYCRALDTCDWELLGSCFTEDGVLDVGPWGTHTGVETIVSLCAGLFPGFDRTQHVVANHVITISGDTATCTCDLVAEHLLRSSAGGDQTTTRAVYRDELVRADRRWKIARRKLDIIWREGNISLFEEAAARVQAGQARTS
jgi:hypothetical protein